MVQCVAVCCSVLLCAAVCCCVMQCTAIVVAVVLCCVSFADLYIFHELQCSAVCCSCSCSCSVLHLLRLHVDTCSVTRFHM